MAFQDNLKMYREQAGYTSAKEFADVLGVSYSTYLGYESKGIEPKFELLIKIADSLGVPISKLLGVNNEGNEFIKKIKNIIVSEGFSVSFNENNYMIITKPNFESSVYLSQEDFYSTFAPIYKKCNDRMENDLRCRVRGCLLDKLVDSLEFLK